jgi:DNA-binding protein HU-beta
MTKTELIKELKEAVNVDYEDAATIVNELGDIMAAELLGGGEVPLPGIGKLVVKDTPARKGRNPKTGETIDVPAGRKVVLKVGKHMKETLKG